MGLISDKCLKPDCDGRVKKAAKFCSKCGGPASNGWWKCHSCRKWVGVEAKFCWNCKTPLHPEEREAVAGGRWLRSPGVFAQRIELGEMKSLLTNGLTVEWNVQALIAERGQLVDVLQPGTHTPEAMARKVNNWGSPPPRTAILVEAGDIVLPMRFDDIRTSEGIPIDLYGEVVLQFQPKQGGDFLKNLMKEERQITYADLMQVLTGEATYAVRNLCEKSTLDDLARDPARRLHIEDELQTTLETSAGRYGLTVARVSSMEITGKAYEALRSKEGDLEIQRRELEFSERLRGVLLKDKMHTFKSEKGLEEYVDQLAQEKGVKDEMRLHEFRRLSMVHRQELEVEDAAHKIKQEMAERIHSVELARSLDDYERDKALANATNEAVIAEKWLAVRERKLKLKREHEKERLAVLKGHSLADRLQVEEDPDRRAALERLIRLEKAGSMSPEQMLAAGLIDSDAAAEALSQHYAAQGKKLDMDQVDGYLKTQLDTYQGSFTSLFESLATAVKNPDNIVRGQ